MNWTDLEMISVLIDNHISRLTQYKQSNQKYLNSEYKGFEMIISLSFDLSQNKLADNFYSIVTKAILNG